MKGCLWILAIGFGLAFLGAVFGHSSPSSTTTTAAEPAAVQAEPDQAAPAAPKPVSVQQLKRAFIAGVDESVSTKRIMGAPYKFVGHDVDLHGSVASIVDEQHFNLTSGGVNVDDDGNVSDSSGTVVVECNSTKDLEKGQSLRVLGTVMPPIEGTNMMGGSSIFAAIHAEYME